MTTSSKQVRWWAGFKLSDAIKDYRRLHSASLSTLINRERRMKSLRSDCLRLDRIFVSILIVTSSCRWNGDEVDPRPACTQTTMQQQKTLKTLTGREPLMPRHRFVFFGLTSLNVNIHSYRRPEYYSQLFPFRFSSSFVRQDGSRRSCLFVFISGP